MLNSIRNLPQIRHLHKASSMHLELSPEVRSALANNEPVVALESTIITHGMPFPRNYETAVKVENICRLKVRKPLTRLCKWFHAEWIRVHELFTSFELPASVQLQNPHCLPLCLLYFCPQGAVPATIGILKGQIHVGLTNDQLEELAAKKVPCIKTSRRDFPYVLSQVCWTLLFPLPSCIVTNSLPYLNAILLRLGKPDRNWMEALQSLVPWLLQPKLAFQYLSQVSLIPSSLNLFARGNEGVTRVLLIKSFVLWNVISLS